MKSANVCKEPARTAGTNDLRGELLLLFYVGIYGYEVPGMRFSFFLSPKYLQLTANILLIASDAYGTKMFVRYLPTTAVNVSSPWNCALHRAYYDSIYTFFQRGRFVG